MLKFFYRLKRRGGVVLFAVIAIMTLLIAMASTAYFTARSSYKTVVSNYNFSQMYLAATSVSDMIIAAATQESQDSLNTSILTATEGKNYFKDFKNKIKDLKDEYDGGTSKPHFVMTSQNIYGKTTENDIYEAGEANPVANGIVDAIVVNVTLEDALTHDDISSIPEGRTNYYYTFTTTAYYNRNSITIQDTVYNQAKDSSSTIIKKKKEPAPAPTSFFTSTGQQYPYDKTSRVVIIDTKEISDKAYFQGSNTVFLGNKFENVFKGGITSTGSVFLAHQCSLSVAPPTDNGDGTGDRHDWIIGGDLGIIHDNVAFDLNGNNLYVKGDLIVSNQNGILNAENIFVEGNLYVLAGKCPISSSTNLYVGGNIIAGDPYALNLGNTYGSRISTWHTVKDELNGIKSAVDNASARATETGGETFELKAHNPNQTGSSFTNGWAFSGTLKQGVGGTVSGFGGGVIPANPGTYDPASITVQIANMEIDQATGHTFNHVLQTTSVATVFDPTNANSPTHDSKFEPISADSDTLDNLLDLDFVSVDVDDDSNWTWNLAHTAATITYTTITGQTITGTKDASGDMEFLCYPAVSSEPAVVERSGSGNKDVTIKIPWYKDGYNLSINSTYSSIKHSEWWTETTVGFPFSGNGEKKILFETKASTYKQEENEETHQLEWVVDEDNTMPIVLRGNFNDGTSKPTDENGYNAFSWMGGAYNSEDSTDWVLLTDDSFEGNAPGNVVFEMGNLDEDGNYIQYDYEHSKNSITYFTAQKECVCTMQQKEKMAAISDSPWESHDAVVSMLQPGTSDPYSDYEDRVMIVSNQNQGTAFNMYRKGNLVCGYLYAPNGSLYNFADGKTPVFGGMIVSDYAAIHAYYVYAEPDPLIVKDLMGPLSPPSGDPEEIITTEWVEDSWFTGSDEIMGRNFLG